MHVLIVALHRPNEPTGVCRHAANLARCLAELDKVARITLVTGAWQQHYFKNDFLFDPEKISVLGVDIKNTSLSRNLWFLFELPNLVKKLQPDLVHLSFPIPFIRSLFACPVVVTIHDLYPYKIPENFGKKQALFNRLFLWQCIRNSDAIACVSNATLADLQYYFPDFRADPNRARVIYNVVDFVGGAAPIENRIGTDYPQELQSQGERPFILCVGQHRKNKNFDLLIQSYSVPIRDGRLTPDVRLIIVGSPGPETDKLHQSIQNLGLQDSVVTLSAIKDRTLCWLYQNSQLVVIPSSVEGFCIPLVEALYFSCKVVCSDIPVFREIAADNCIYFDLEGNAIENLTQAIVTALESELCPASDRCSRFTKAAISSQYWDFYSQVI